MRPIWSRLRVLTYWSSSTSMPTHGYATTRSDGIDARGSLGSAWNSARVNRAPWTEYAFDWSTDYCSSSPDNPFGFPFSTACARHDFGYRNYKAVEQFPANKARLDQAFYADLKRKCNTYNAVVRPACLSLAWTYYQAVSVFGSVSASHSIIGCTAASAPPAPSAFAAW